MKLKKIASLALAGVMAVSMLAGCNYGGSSSSTTNNNTQTVTTSDTVTAMKDAMAEYAPDLKITVKGATNIEAYMKALDDQSKTGLSESIETAVKNFLKTGTATVQCIPDDTTVAKALNPQPNAAVGDGDKYYSYMLIPVEDAAGTGMTALEWAANQFAKDAKDLTNTYVNSYTGPTDQEVEATITLYTFRADYQDANGTVPCFVVIVETELAV